MYSEIEPGLRDRLKEAHAARIKARDDHIYWTKECIRLEAELDSSPRRH